MTPTAVRIVDKRAAQTDALFKRLARARSRRESRRIRDEIVLLNMPVAGGVTQRFRRRGIPTADLEQVAYVGLLKAVSRYDLGHGKDFLAFAVPTIAGELKRHFRDNGWMVRPPRRIQELQAQISTVSNDLAQRLGRSPRPHEVARELGRDEEEVIEALASDGAFTPASLDAPAGRHSTSTVGDFLVDDDVEAERADARILLGPAMRALGERDRLIVELRFFHGWSQQRIGEEIGVTQMQVSRLLSRILTDLRAAIG